jgi:hypothetical protein
MNKIICLLFLLSILLSCQTEKISRLTSNVGDIEFDEKLDDKNFNLCNFSTLQYFNLEKGFQYEGEKLAIVENFERLNLETDAKSNGYINIRFIVNCEGKMERFRVQQFNSDYKEFSFNKNFVNEILKFTKNLNGWKNLEKRDYYQYLTFKIENGKVTEILP